MREELLPLAGATPGLMVTDPPYGVSLDMEWRDRAGANALGPAQPSYMQRADGHSNTTISGDDKADWSDAFELIPSLRVAYVWHASAHTIEVGPKGRPEKQVVRFEKIEVDPAIDDARFRMPRR